MKIDIHTHTRKIKSGDADSRNIEANELIEIIKETDVNILAITNHNHFDKTQYEVCRDGVAGNCQVWPGIELDIVENSKRAHLIVICNPRNVDAFNQAVVKILGNQTGDAFTTTIKTTVENFDKLDVIYIAHYFVKKPNLGDSELQILYDLISNPKRILKEATNAISAGVYISHGHNSIYGSDVQDWADYVEIAKTLPELRLPVESFEQFCLLLEKDEATINTLLDKKIKENIEIAPFTAAEIVRLDIYNDINILFGSKGTGKTQILGALSTYFNQKGHKTEVYKSNDTHLNEVYDIRGLNFSCEVSDFGIEECKEEIAFLRTVTEGEVTSMSKYHAHFASTETNKLSQTLKIKNIHFEDPIESKRDLKEVGDLLTEFEAIDSYTEDNAYLAKYVDAELIRKFKELTSQIIGTLLIGTEEKLIESKSIDLLNSLVTKISREIAKKTGQPPKPMKTGFADYARNRIEIERVAKKISSCIAQPIAPMNEIAGSLGIKGELYCQTNLIIQNGTFTDASYKTVKAVKKVPQKDFVRTILAISKRIHENDLFEKIAELNSIEGGEVIEGISHLLLQNRHFTLNGDRYEPSNGESSMILLHRALVEDKDIYLIDEPEKSLGNDYINDVIVPLLKQQAALGKKVIIATHDANIAVRTLPYNSIYRLHDKGLYYTMTGNPFSNTLRCINGSRADLNWKDISMKTLEGGREAFGERGKIYGN